MGEIGHSFDDGFNFCQDERQPRPQGFSLFPTHFLREKPWGRGWMKGKNRHFRDLSQQVLAIETDK